MTRFAYVIKQESIAFFGVTIFPTKLLTSLEPIDGDCLGIIDSGCLVATGGDDREKEIVGERFKELMEHDWLRNWVLFKFRIVEDLFQKRMPDLIQWAVRFGCGHTHTMALPTSTH